MSLAVEVNGLRKVYGETVAVDSVDLAVRQGEIFALLGPNGAGKSTTTEILEGHRTRDSGYVRVLGEDPQRATTGWRDRIGIVLQDAGDFAELTVAEVVHHFTGYYRTPRDADEVIEAVGLTEKRKARAARLSGGQRRRLDVALGILGRPKLLFLDEPTTGFDPEVRRRFWQLIKSLQQGGTTILLTTHYLDEAEHLADRVGVISAGRVVEVNTPSRLGGRDMALAIVRWTENGRSRQIRTRTPAGVVTELVARFRGEVPDLVVTRPSLEDIYLDMIGASR